LESDGNFLALRDNVHFDARMTLHHVLDRCDYPSPPEMVLARPERVNQKAKPSLTGLLLSRRGGRPISHRHRSHVPNSKIAREINPPTSSERNDPSANNPIHPARQCADSRIRTLQPLARAGLGRPSFGGTEAACRNRKQSYQAAEGSNDDAHCQPLLFLHGRAAKARPKPGSLVP
jgi:hypothetical protein